MTMVAPRYSLLQKSEGPVCLVQLVALAVTVLARLLQLAVGESLVPEIRRTPGHWLDLGELVVGAG